MSWIDLSVLSAYYLVLFALAVYGLHRLHLVRLLRRCDSAPPVNEGPVPASGEWPAVTVQLPVFNEPNVVERLIEAACAIRYSGRLEIQVLDDSTDCTSGLAAVAVARARDRGVNVHHIRRNERSGFKAGALAAGMLATENQFFLIFDADFVPAPDVLERMIPAMSDPSVGMVQARWDHLNRDHSMLTRVQAVYLDGHFAIESAARYRGGYFFNFNGTAGLWRRDAIDEAGGWSAATLTEDLDLSYRAQMAGWKFVFLPDLAVHAELPEMLSGFQGQQHRWVKGSVQTARRILPGLLRRRLPARVKLEALFHLTGNCCYPLTLLLGILIVPALVVRHGLKAEWSLLLDLGLFACSTLPVLLFYAEGQRRVGQRLPAPLTLLAVLPIGIGLSVRNSFAVLQGLTQRGGIFQRTPKRGSAAAAGVPAEVSPFPFVELALGAWFLTSLVGFAAGGLFPSLLFLLLFLGGYGHVAVLGLRERAGRNSALSHHASKV